MREWVWSDCVVFTSVLSARPSSERLAIRFGGNAIYPPVLFSLLATVL